MATETNHYAEEQLKKRSFGSRHSRLKKWVPVTSREIHVFLLLLLSQCSVQKLCQEWYWSKSKLLHAPIFEQVMSSN